MELTYKPEEQPVSQSSSITTIRLLSLRASHTPSKVRDSNQGLWLSFLWLTTTAILCGPSLQRWTRDRQHVSIWFFPFNFFLSCLQQRFEHMSTRSITSCDLALKVVRIGLEQQSGFIRRLTSSSSSSQHLPTPLSLA